MKHNQVVRLQCPEKAFFFEFRLIGYPDMRQGESIRFPDNPFGIPSGEHTEIIGRKNDGLRGCIVFSVPLITTGLFDTPFARWKELNGPNAKAYGTVYVLPDIEWVNPK